jgi:16S rRNA (guanine966-N2)-methyltransferase
MVNRACRRASPTFERRLMRIVAGRWRGRRIDAPRDERVRPTGDRVREAWMSIVNADLPDARVLDLFAGSGALGLEALSRGAAVVDFVEIAAKSLAALRANAESLGAGSAAVIHRADALRFVERLEPHAYDVAFADPPYDLGLASKVAERWLDVPFADVLGIEHRMDEVLPGGGDRRRYGGTVITFFRCDPSS